MVYLILYRNYLQDITVFKYVDLKDAEAALAAGNPDDPAVGGFIVDTGSNMGGISPRIMVDLFNMWRGPEDKAIVKFENRVIARQRFIARLEARFQSIPAIEGPTQESPRAPAQEDSAMAAKAEKKTKAKKTNGEGRVIGKPAGLVGDFRPVRNGTDRQKTLKMMDGTKTIAQIAAKLENADTKKVLTIAYCINRDSAIGYKLTEDDKLLAIYPGSKTYEDAIKPDAT